jgi:hypothetical protein
MLVRTIVGAIAFGPYEVKHKLRRPFRIVRDREPRCRLVDGIAKEIRNEMKMNVYEPRCHAALFGRYRFTITERCGASLCEALRRLEADNLQRLCPLLDVRRNRFRKLRRVAADRFDAEF